MRPIGYFLLLFFCVSANMIYNMDFSTQEEQRYPQAQTRQYAQSVAQRYAEQQNAAAQTQQYAQAAAQRYPQPQFAPRVDVVHGYSASSHYCQPWPSTPTNSSELPPDLSNPNKPYDFQLQKKKKAPKAVETATTLIALRVNKPKNSTSLNTTQKLSSPIKTDNPAGYKFPLKCPSCEQKFDTTEKANPKFNFKNHCKSICQLTTKEMDRALKKTFGLKKIRRFTIPCPIGGCTPIQKTGRSKSDLRSRLLQHVDSKIHSDNSKKVEKRELIATEESFKEHFKNHGKIKLISNPNPKKRKLQHQDKPFDKAQDRPYYPKKRK